MVFHGSLNEIKSPQVYKTLLSILADLNDAVVWMISVRPQISNSSIPVTKRLGIIPSAKIKTGITINFMFHTFFLFSGKVQVLVTLFVFFDFTLWSGRLAMSVIRQFHFFVIITRSGRMAGIK